MDFQQDMVQIVRQTQSQAQEQKTSQKEIAVQMAEQSPETIQALLEEMLLNGEIEMDLVPEFGEELSLDDEIENDAELSLADEDAEDFEDSRPGMRDGAEDAVFANRPLFELRVLEQGRGRFACIPPKNEWATAKAALYSQGKAALYALGERFKTFRIIAEWLERENLLDKGAESFLERHAPMEQKRFAKANGLDEKALSRHIKNACLSWGDEAIPLRDVFS